jgi:DNA-binding CsgD family transcriptional regulator
MENGYDVATSNENDSCDLTGFNLDERELTYCNLLLDGYTNAEISKKLNTSIMTLSNLRKKLRIKLATTI